MNALTIAGLFIALTSIVLVGILLRYGATKLHRLWLLYNVAVGVWGLGCILISLSRTEQAALGAWKIAVLGADLVPAIFYHFVVIFTKKKETKLVYVFYLFGLALLLTNYIGLGNPHIAVLNFLFNSFYFIRSASILYSILLIAWIFIVLLGNLELFQYYRRCSPDEKNRTAYLFFGFLVGFSGGLTNFPPHFGINLYPFGNFMIPLYSIIVVYAILKHQLLNIIVVIRKSIVYTLLIGLVSLAYLSTIFLFEKFLQESFGYRSLSLSFSAALILGTILIPLRNQIQYFVDKYFFHASMPELALENTLLRREVTDKEKFKEVAVIASSLVHEVKNAITPVKTFLEFFPQKKNDPEFIEKFRRIATQELERTEGLTRQLLDFAKPSAPVFKQVNIHELLVDTLILVERSLQQKGISLKRDFSSDGVWLNIDPQQIKQALLNILKNAVEVMPQGGTLTVGTKIETKDRRPKTNSLEISIEDTGPGIAPEDLKHLFEPFYSKKQGGTGLGLAITKDIIERHGGRIKIESKLGKGTRFIMELPIKNGQ